MCARYISLISISLSFCSPVTPSSTTEQSALFRFLLKLLLYSMQFKPMLPQEFTGVEHDCAEDKLLSVIYCTDQLTPAVRASGIVSHIEKATGMAKVHQQTFPHSQCCTFMHCVAGGTNSHSPGQRILLTYSGL